jgi:lipopolysaccharide biosynthesis regulator YciM
MEVLLQASLNLTDADKSQQLELHFRLGKAHKNVGDIDNAIKVRFLLYST